MAYHLERLVYGFILVERNTTLLKCLVRCCYMLNTLTRLTCSGAGLCFFCMLLTRVGVYVLQIKLGLTGIVNSLMGLMSNKQVLDML